VRPIEAIPPVTAPLKGAAATADYGQSGAVRDSPYAVETTAAALQRRLSGRAAWAACECLRSVCRQCGKRCELSGSEWC
jgi:hypothetical protein